MGHNPSGFTGNANKPVENVSWNDARAFCQKLSRKTGKKYRLPSEAEWEYACRAGTTTRYFFGDNANQLEQYAWFWGSSNSGTHPVGQIKPNPWGLYDLYGNIWEWCEDGWHKYYKGAPVDGTAWNDNHVQSQRRVIRGGSWGNNPQNCRSASRLYDNFDRRHYNNGFRVVVSL
jgi:formylglycine-generating enzyme required for sulfatase activity